MDPCIEQRLIQLLRDSNAPTIPLRDLHCALAAEAGPEAGSYARLEDAMRRRRDLFLVLETASPLGDATDWPPSARSEYERELVAAGIDTGPQVSLVDPGHDPLDDCRTRGREDPLNAPLRQLRDSLLRIWQAADGNSALRGTVAAALSGCRELPAVLRAGDDAGS